MLSYVSLVTSGLNLSLLTVEHFEARNFFFIRDASSSASDGVFGRGEYLNVIPLISDFV